MLIDKREKILLTLSAIIWIIIFILLANLQLINEQKKEMNKTLTEKQLDILYKKFAK